MSVSGESNCRLMIELLDEHRTKGFEPTGSFFEVAEDWHCPVCLRDKRQIARLTKNASLLCRLVVHHDHFEDEIRRKLKDVKPYSKLQAIISSLVRFQPIVICEDCNNVDAVAKSEVGAPAPFSFAPFELAVMITPVANEPHSFDAKVAAQVYELARVQMRQIFVRFTSLRAYYAP
jgi:rubredoxin